MKDDSYSLLWRILTAIWNSTDKAELLTNTEQLYSAIFEGTLEVRIAAVVVHCPFVEVKITIYNLEQMLLSFFISPIITKKS